MRSKLLLIAALFCGTALAQPATGYDYATPAGTTSVTGFSYIVDLANLSASWWSEAENVDGTRGRVYDDNGSTRYAADWIDYDHTGNTGLVRFQVPGAGAVPDVRIYPPVAANATVVASDTYGSNNAYDASWVAYWPNGGGDDRTANQHNATGVNNPTFGGVAGNIGLGTNYDGINQHATVPDHASFDIDTGTILVWVTYTANVSWQAILDHYNFTTGGYVMARRGVSDDMSIRYRDGSANIESRGGTLGASFAQYVSTFSPTNSELWENGVSVDSDIGTLSAGGASSDSLYIANGSVGSVYTDYWKGIINELALHNVIRPNDWIAVEYSQTSDNATFWGAWTYVAAAGGVVDLFHGVTYSPLYRGLVR